MGMEEGESVTGRGPGELNWAHRGDSNKDSCHREEPLSCYMTSLDHPIPTATLQIMDISPTLQWKMLRVREGDNVVA